MIFKRSPVVDFKRYNPEDRGKFNLMSPSLMSKLEITAPDKLKRVTF
jgi:hypothetical protein